jgi:hypothetical protein
MSHTTITNIRKNFFRPVAMLLVLIALAVLVTSCSRPFYRGGHHHYLDDTGISQDRGIKYNPGQGHIF